MATEPQDTLTDQTQAKILKNIQVNKSEAPTIYAQLLQATIVPHSQFWSSEASAEMNARLAAERQTFNEMLARKIPSCVAPPPLSDEEKAMKKLIDEIASRTQPEIQIAAEPITQPGQFTFARRP